MGCTKSSAKREADNNTSLPQEIRKLQINNIKLYINN